MCVYFVVVVVASDNVVWKGQVFDVVYVVVVLDVVVAAVVVVNVMGRG